jgi:hypothetical protein
MSTKLGVVFLQQISAVLFGYHNAARLHGFVQPKDQCFGIGSLT